MSDVSPRELAQAQMVIDDLFDRGELTRADWDTLDQVVDDLACQRGWAMALLTYTQLSDLPG